MSWIQPILFTLTPHIGGFGGTFLIKDNFKPGRWYEKLKKPSFIPPRWIIPPIWLSLYSGMGYASYLIYRDGGGWFTEENTLPLALYGTQLALNWTWAPLFFGLHKPGLGMLNISTLWGVIVGCIWTFSKVNMTASYLMIPYLGWISLASAINFYVWRNNKSSVTIEEIGDKEE